MKKPELVHKYNVVIVGAGAAGIGVALALQRCGVENIQILEREQIGAAFTHWPAEMRFITPSFPSNAFGLADLNGIAPELSVALDIEREHPSGPEFAAHLERVAGEFNLAVETGVEVFAIEPVDGGFEVATSKGPVRTRFVVWTAGEFFYPRAKPFPGAELCLHNSRIKSYSKLSGKDFIVIGGYESGMDAAVYLAAAKRRGRVLDPNAAWAEFDKDPSRSLSPYTIERVNTAVQSGKVKLIGGVCVAAVERRSAAFVVKSTCGREFISTARPILATGFEGSLQLIRNHLDWSDEGDAQLSKKDESQKVPGLFVCGPMLRQRDVKDNKIIFCFIYKFRMRFMVVAAEIAARLGRDPEEIEAACNFYRSKGMLLDDLSCCDVECGC